MRKFLLVCLLLCISFYAQARENPKAAGRLSSNSLAFTENKGQVVDTRGNERPDVLFTTEVNGAKLYFRKDAISYVFSKIEVDARTQVSEVKGLYRMDLEFIGANSNVQVTSETETGMLSHFYNTSSPVIGVRSYSRLVYKNLYNNIDLVFYAGKNGGMKYDFVVRPGGNVNDIRLRHSAADRVTLDKGALTATNSYGSVTDDAPYTFVQTPSGAQGRVVASQYLVKDGVISFQVGNYSKNETLVIDPFQVVANTYLGGTTLDQAYGVARDASGNVTITGYTQSNPFPVTSGASQGNFGGSNDAFVAQYGPTGQPNWVTYYGGTSIDQGNDVAVDGQGNVIVSGVTASQGISRGSVFQSSWAGGSDAFIAKFTSGGQLTWASYLGGAQVDQGLGVAVDGAGDIYVGGVTYSAAFPVSGAAAGTFGGSRDGFVTKIASSGANTLWSRFVGGSAIDIINKLDVNGNTVIAVGQTGSTPFAGFVRGIGSGGGSDDMIFASFNAGSGATNWGFISGGAGADVAYGVDINDAGTEFAVAGSSIGSSEIAFQGGIQPNSGGGEDGIIAKARVADGVIVWGTYLGGSQIDRALDVAISSTGDVFATGLTFSTNFPASSNALQSNNAGNSDAFVARYSANGSTLCDATYYGGSGSDIGRSINVNGNSVVFAGQSISVNFLKGGQVPAAQQNRGGNDDAVVVWLNTTGNCGGGGPVCNLSASATGVTSTSATISTSGAAGAVSYAWSIGGPSVANRSDLTANTNYTVTVTDAGVANCERIVNFRTSGGQVNCNLSASAANVTTTSANIVANGNVGALSYTWSDGATAGASRTNLVAGTCYTVTVVDVGVNNCQAVVNFCAQSNNGAFTIQETSGDPNKLTICEEGTVTISVANAVGTNYRWVFAPTGSTSFTTVGTGATYTIVSGMPMQTGSYKAIDAANRESNTLNITVYPLPSVETTPSGNAVICSGSGFAQVCGIAQTNVVYMWFGVTTVGNRRIEGPETSSPCFNITENGTYYLRARNVITGCVDISAPVAVTTVPGPAAPTITAGGNTAICEGNTVTITRSNEAGFTYVWRRNGQSLGVSGTSLTVSEAGCYTIFARAANGCEATSNEVCVTISPTPTATVSASGGTEFCTVSSITTVLTATPGAGNTYAWRRNGVEVVRGGSNVFRPTSGGVYDAIVTNVQGCATITNGVTVTINPLSTPVISTNGPTEYCVGDNINLLITTTASPGATYQWFRDGQAFGSPSTINSIIASAAGIYRVQVTSGVCSGTSNDIIVTQTPKPTATVSISGLGLSTICEDGSINLVANSGENFMYQWFRNGLPITGATSRTLLIDSRVDKSVIGVANYTVSVGRFGCMSDQSNPLEITVYPLPTGAIRTPNNATALCIGQSMMLDASEDLTSPNANNPLELVYTWRFNGAVIPGANMNMYRAENPGRYQVEILNTRTGCRKVSDVDLTTTTPPVVTVFANGNTTFCSGGEVTLTASPMGNSYRWFRNGEIISGATMRMYTATMSGNYQAEVTDGACSAVSASGITVNAIQRPSAEITIDGDTDFCSNANNTVLRTQPGADSYQWLMAATAMDMPMAIPGANTNTFRVTRQGFYWVVVTKDGCTDTTNNPIDISVRLAPRATIVANGNLVQCAGSRDLVLTAQPPGANLSYQWLVGDRPEVASAITGANEAEYVPTFTGRFWVLITNTRGCSTLSAPIDVKFKPIPTVRISHIPDSIVCQDGSVRMMAMASGAEPGDAYEYQWFRNGQPIDNTNSARFSATESGDYFVIVTAALCSSPRSNQINAKVYPNPDITISLSGLNAPCDGVTLNAVEMMDHSYQWLRNGIIIPGATNAAYTTVEPGNYNVTIRNIVTGCEETSLGLVVHPNPVADAGSAIEICAGNTGRLNGSAIGGNGTYNYMWMEPAGLSGTLSNPTVANPTVTVNVPGTYVYSLQVTDGRNCINAPLSFVTVTVNPNPVANAGADQVVCSGDAFRLMGSATGGDGGPYSFQWAGPNGFTFTGSMSDFLQIDEAGTYIFNLTTIDGNGCTGTDQVSVEVKPEPGIIAVQYNDTQLFGADQLSPKSFCFGNKLVVESTVRGDFYEWFRDGVFVQGGVDNRYTVFIGGKYTIVVSHNVAGIRCTSRTTYDVTVFPEPVAQVFPIDNNVICPGGKTLRAVEAPGYTYQWLVGNTPATAVPASGMSMNSTYVAMTAGRYWVLVTTTEGGCQKLSSPLDLTNTTLTTNYIIGEPSRCGANDGSIQVNATSAVFPILYSVNGGTERAGGLFTNLSAGSYTVRAREVGGCVAETTIVLTVDAPRNLRVDVASITSSEATVLWDQIPAGTGNTRYNVRYRVRGAESWENTIRGINGNLADLVSLQHDTRYQVEVQTVCSDPSVMSKWTGIEFSTRANGAACEMPSDIYVNIMTAPNMVPTVYWDNVSNSACYDLEYRTVTPMGEWVLLQVNSAQNPFALVGLQPATKYEVRMRSHCNFCNGTNRSEYSPNIPFVTPGVCNPNQTVSINNGVSVVNNCGNYTLVFDGTVLPNYGFQWRVNGQEIGGANSNELLVTESGDYDLVLTVGNCEPLFSNGVEVNVRPIPEVIANVQQNVSCISGGDGIITAGCVDTDRIICNQSRTDFLYRLVGNNGYDSGFQPSGIFPGLRPGTYTAIILDQNTGCTDTYTDEVFTTITSPDKARFVSAVGQNQSEARIQWTSVFGANAYVLSYRPVGSSEQNWTDVLFDGGCPFPGNCDYILGGLQNNTTYEVRVQTRCAQGNVLSDWTDTTSFFTAPLAGCPVEDQAIPGGIYAVVTEMSATINWNAVTNGVRYQVRYRQAGQDEAQSIILPETAGRSQLITGLIANTSYAYEVRTICGSNIAGEWSETRFFKTLFFRGAEVAVNLSDEVSVYPNPNNGQFTVNFNAAENGTAIVRMFDVTGKVVLNRTQEVVKGQGSINIEINGYASGIYMLHFTQSGVAKVIKVVIN